MKRIGLTLALVLGLGAAVVATAGAENERNYQAELFNAFGLVDGSELRVGGVKAGTITDLDITSEKTALVSFSVGPEFPELKADASCSSEPQSLIAEYFLDCQPGSSEEALEGPIPAARNTITVQNDLVQNTLREPFKRRFQLLINEFGTALVGNPENLNAAIRAGAPALRELREVLQTLGSQNRLIAELNVNSDLIFERLAERRDDVVEFVDQAEDTARVSVERRRDLARDFELLDDFLAELRPTMVELGNLAREQTPLLTDLRAAAPGLNRLAANLPRFNDGTRVSLKSLGRASRVGRRALTKAREEIRALNVASRKAHPAADLLANFLESLDNPREAVAETCKARRDLREQPGEADRRVALLEEKLGTTLTGDRSCDPSAAPGTGNPGYTGLEGLLNYGYIQTTALNLFDTIGHALHINIVGASAASEAGGECGHYSAHQDYPSRQDPSVRTTDVREAPYCAALLGATQPGINFDLNLPKYHPSVCPDGSTDHSICDPSGGARSARAQQAGGRVDIEQLERLFGPAPESKEDKDELREILGLPPGAKLPENLTEALGSLGGGPATSTANDLLGFLFGS